MLTERNRIDVVDGLRGWALLGILMANLLIFQYGLIGKDHISFYHLSPLDETSYHVVKIFVESSFLPIFTFIFGYALVLMSDSLKQEQRRVKWHLFRRFLVLLVLGILHSSFLWEGDILFLYGYMGLFLLMFVHRKPKTLLIWGLTVFILFSGTSFLGSDSEDEMMSPSERSDYIEETTKVNSSGTYTEIKDHRNNSDPMKLEGGEAVFMFLLTPLVVSPMSLLGMYAGRKKWLHEPWKKTRMYCLGFVLLIPCGIVLKALPYLMDSWQSLDMSIAGGQISAAGYICLFALLFSYFSRSRVFSAFCAMGKLSLTNYIMQTIICTSLFYGYGLGQFGKMGVTFSLFVGVLIFTVQAGCSMLYLTYFKQGPLEKVMRCCIYLWKPRSNTKAETPKAS
ncbi:DUF418 domain-containing protein [Salibacterium aidingense]|uniref:DUF418 domain-containing protein n=1 Tax=Salibacterium aidingense TaxID=384933 RepID=UPI003BE2E736